MTSPAAPSPARPVLVLGVTSAAVAGLLAVCAAADRWLLAALLLVVQVGFVVGWAVVMDTPGTVGTVAIGAGAAAASDGLLLSSHHVSLPAFAVIVAFAFLLSLGWQIARPGRTRVTDALAATLAGAVFAVAGGSYLTLRSYLGGRQPTVVALLGVGAALGVARLVDAFWVGPRIVERRGLPGLLIGVLAASGVGALYGSQAGSRALPDGLFYGTLFRGVSAGTGLLIAVVAGAAALVVDLGLAGASPACPVPWPARLVVGATLPVLLAAPPAYVIAKLALT